MRRLESTRTWYDVRSRLRRRYRQLTNEDLILVKGQEEELLTRLQKKLKKSRDEVLRLIETI